MSKKSLTLCDVCGEEISWLEGAHLNVKENVGTKPLVYPTRAGPTFDLCNQHWKRFAEVFAELGIDDATRIAEENKKMEERQASQACAILV